MAEHQHRTEYTLEPIWPCLINWMHVVSEYDSNRIHGQEVSNRIFENARARNATVEINGRDWIMYDFYVRELTRELNETN